MVEKYCNMSLVTLGVMYFLILMCHQDLDISRMNSKVQLMAIKAVVIVCLTHILFNLSLLESIKNARDKTNNAQWSRGQI